MFTFGCQQRETALSSSCWINVYLQRCSVLITSSLFHQLLYRSNLQLPRSKYQVINYFKYSQCYMGVSTSPCREEMKEPFHQLHGPLNNRGDACLTLPRELAALWFISVTCPVCLRSWSTLFFQLGKGETKQRRKEGTGGQGENEGRHQLQRFNGPEERCRWEAEWVEGRKREGAASMEKPCVISK